MPESRTALIAGASGLVGSHLLRLLLQSDQYSHITALVRKPLHMQHPKLTQKQVNFDKLAQESELAATDIFCCLGTTMKQAGSKENFNKVDFTYVTELAKTAAKQGAKQFLVVSAMGANSKSFIFYNKVKGNMENTVKQIPYNSVHIFQPSLLLGNRSQKRTGEKIGEYIMHALEFALVGPFRKYRPIAAETVARTMLKTALQNQPGIHTYTSDKIATF